MFWSIVILAVAVLLAINICTKRYTLFTAVPKNPEDDKIWDEIRNEEESIEKEEKNEENLN